MNIIAQSDSLAAINRPYSMTYDAGNGINTVTVTGINAAAVRTRYGHMGIIAIQEYVSDIGYEFATKL